MLQAQRKLQRVGLAAMASFVAPQTQDDQDAKALISLLAPDGQLLRFSLPTPHQ